MPASTCSPPATTSGGAARSSTTSTRERRLLRPANFPPDGPGAAGRLRRRARVIRPGRGDQPDRARLHGRRPTVRSRPSTRFCRWCGGRRRVIFVDMHGEATSEKGGMGWFLDGRVSAVVGSHTHVQTADETRPARRDGLPDRCRHVRTRATRSSACGSSWRCIASSPRCRCGSTSPTDRTWCRARSSTSIRQRPRHRHRPRARAGDRDDPRRAARAGSARNAVQVIHERGAAGAARGGTAAARQAGRRPHGARHPPRAYRGPDQAARVPGPRPPGGADHRRLHRPDRRPERALRDTPAAHRARRWRRTPPTYQEQVFKMLDRRAPRGALQRRMVRQVLQLEDVVRLAGKMHRGPHAGARRLQDPLSARARRSASTSSSIR